MPASGGKLVDRSLVGRGLLHLDQQSSGLQLQVIQLMIDGEFNEEGFLDVLCASLRVIQPEVCSTTQPETRTSMC